MAAAVLLLPASILAQADSQPVDSPPDQVDTPRLVFSESMDVRWVHIPTVVFNKTEGLAAELVIGDFELLVDGQSVAIETFESSLDTPLSVVYLQDLSGSMNNLDKLGLSRTTFDLLMDGAQASDEFSVVTFSGAAVSVDVPFTTDHGRLRNVSEEWTALGTTGLYDAITWLPEVSLDGRRSKRAAIVVTDGIDNASALTPESAREKVLRTQLPVYVLDLSKFGRRNLSRETPDDPSWPLRALANGTGGRYFKPTDRPQLIAAVSTIVNEVRLQYLLGFAANGNQSPQEHRVEIRVRGRSNSPRYRPRYFGPPPAQFGSVH
jgi:VWFA-related protein